MCQAFACDLLTRAEEGAGHADQAIRLFAAAGDDRRRVGPWGRASLAMQLGDGPTTVRCCQEIAFPLRAQRRSLGARGPAGDPGCRRCSGPATSAWPG